LPLAALLTVHDRQHVRQLRRQVCNQNTTSHSSAELASHFAANTTPDVIFKSFANAQTDFITYYQADDAGCSDGL
jgi:hypothetical protein